MLGHVQAPWRHQHEPPHAVGLLERDRRSEAPAERVTDEGDLVQAEAVEEIEVVHDVVLHAVDARVVGGCAESRVDGQDQPRAVRERQQLVEPGRGPAAVQNDDRRAFAGREHRRVDAVDVVPRLGVGRHQPTAAGAAGARWSTSRIRSSTPRRVASPSVATEPVRQATKPSGRSRTAPSAPVP